MMLRKYTALFLALLTAIVGCTPTIRIVGPIQFEQVQHVRDDRELDAARGGDRGAITPEGPRVGFTPGQFNTDNITTTGSLLLGGTPRSTVGRVRLPSASETILAWRDAGNTADYTAIAKNAAGILYIGRTAGGTAQATDVLVNGTTSAGLQVGATDKLYVDATGVQVPDTTPVRIGSTNVATAGDLRFRNGFAIDVRNGAASGDCQIVNYNVGDVLTLGGTNACGSAGLVLRSGAGSTMSLASINGTDYVNVTSAEFRTSLPIVGEQGNTSPFSVHGFVSHTFAADANYTVTAAQYKYQTLEFVTGSWTVGHTVTFPHPASAANTYTKTIWNSTTKTITVATGTGATQTITTLNKRKFIFTNGGVFNDSADFTLLEIPSNLDELRSRYAANDNHEPRRAAA